MCGALYPARTYCLCVMDNCTRWAEVYPLRTLKASDICDNLLQLFMQMGVASVISSDNGSNFRNALTQEFEKCLGCSPRFNTPYHPEASGVSERWNETFKNLLHHVVRENGRAWHKCVRILV